MHIRARHPLLVGRRRVFGRFQLLLPPKPCNPEAALLAVRAQSCSVCPEDSAGGRTVNAGVRHPEQQPELGAVGVEGGECLVESARCCHTWSIDEHSQGAGSVLGRVVGAVFPV